MVKNISSGSRNDALPMYIHLKIPKCRETVPLSIVLRGSYTTVTREPSQWLTNLYDWLGGQPLGVHTACYSATSHADSVSAGSHGVHFTVSYSTYCSSRRSYGASSLFSATVARRPKYQLPITSLSSFVFLLIKWSFVEPVFGKRLLTLAEVDVLQRSQLTLTTSHGR
jgi:hypothetical protein